MAQPERDPVIIVDPGIQEQLRRLGRRMSDMEPVMAEIGEIVLESIQENFQQEGRPVKWHGLADSTKAQRRAQGRSAGRILNRSGASGLFGSINYRADSDSVAIGTNRIYGPTMHYGARKGEFGTVTVRIREHIMNVRAHTQNVGAHTQNVKAHTRQTRYGPVSVKAHSRDMPAHTREMPARTITIPAHTRRQAIPWGNIPARPFLLVHDEDWVEIGETIDEYLMRGANGQ